MTGADFTKNLINAIIDAIASGKGKFILIDLDGNVISDIPLSTLARTRIYEQTFEDGTSDLTANNATQTVQSTEVYSGSYALQVTISAGQTGYVETPPRPVSPNQQVTFAFAHKEDANITDIKLIVVWYRTNMHELATEEFTLDVTDTWQLDSRTVTAPKNAAYMALRIQATAGASDGNVYIDDITIDLIGQIFRVDGAGQIKVADTDLLDEIQTKLDVALSTRAAKDEGETITIANNEDISAGKTAALKNFKRWTLYLKTAGAIDITIELSPDGGTTWYKAPESPISFSAAGDDVVEMGYDCTHIKLTGSNTTDVTAQIRGVY